MVSKTIFDFFPSWVALNSYKYWQKGALIESRWKMSTLLASGLSVCNVLCSHGTLAVSTMWNYCQCSFIWMVYRILNEDLNVKRTFKDLRIQSTLSCYVERYRIRFYGCFLMLQKPLLVHFCAMVQVLLSVFSISFIKSLGDCTHSATLTNYQFSIHP